MVEYALIMSADRINETQYSRRDVLRMGLGLGVAKVGAEIITTGIKTGVAVSLAMQFVRGVTSSGRAEAAGFEEMWIPDLNTYYPGDARRAAALGMRQITEDDSGVAFLDTASTTIARERYGIEAAFDNLGWFRDFQEQTIALKKQQLSPAKFEAWRNSFGLCNARSAWATRDAWPFRHEGDPLFDISGLVAPSVREMAEMMILGYAPFAFYYKSDDQAVNRAFFRDRALANPGEVSVSFMADIPEGQTGEWWGHVAAVEKGRNGNYWYYVSRAGETYRWFEEGLIRWAIEPANYADLNNPPKPRPGLKLITGNSTKYRSPFYYAPFARAIYYQEPLPSKEHLTAFLDNNQINYRSL